MVRAAVIVLLAALAAAAPAQAASPWGPPQPLPTAGNLPDAIAFSPAGAGVALYSEVGDNVDSYRAGRATGASRFGPGHRIELGAAPSGADQLALYGYDRVVVADRTTVRFGRSDGALGRSHPIGVRAHNTGRVRLAADGGGDLVIAATATPDRSQTGNGRVYLTVRRHGRPIPALRLVSPVGRIRAFAVATDDRGDAVVAWVRGDRVEARVRTLGGRLTPVQHLGSSAANATIASALGRRRRATVAWSSFAGRPELPASGTTVAAAVAGPGGRFAAGRVLEADGDRAVPPLCRNTPLRVVQRTGDTAAVAWSGRDAGHSVVRVAAAGGSGVGSPQTYATPGGDDCLGDLAAAPGGQAALLVQQLGASTATLQGAVGVGVGVGAGAGATFGPLETVLAPFGTAPRVALAFDPATASPVALTDGADDRLRVITRAPVGP